MMSQACRWDGEMATQCNGPKCRQREPCPCRTKLDDVIDMSGVGVSDAVCKRCGLMVHDFVLWVRKDHTCGYTKEQGAFV